MTALASLTGLSTYRGKLAATSYWLLKITVGYGELGGVAPLRYTSQNGMYRPLNRSKSPPSGLPRSPVRTNDSLLGSGGLGMAIRLRISMVEISAPCEVEYTTTLLPAPSSVLMALFSNCTPWNVDWPSVRFPSCGV